MQQRFITSTMLAAMLTGIFLTAGCKVERPPAPEPQDVQKKAQADGTAVTVLNTPTTDNAAAVIASCGPAGSDQVITVTDRTATGPVRRLVYGSGQRQTTLDFIPLQTGSGNGQATTSSNTAWRFSQAVVDNQRLVTAANVRVYLPCAANALANEF